MFDEAIGHWRILRVRYVPANEEEALDYRLAPVIFDDSTDATSPVGPLMIVGYWISDSYQPRWLYPRVLRLDVSRFISIENTAGVLDPLAPSRETELAQLQDCLDRVLARFRFWVPSMDDLEDCRGCVLFRAWNEPIVEQLIHGARLAELNGWLRQCVRNELLDWHRSRRREAALRSRAVVASPPLMSPYQSIDFGIQLQQTLDNLPPSQARLICLALMEGLSVEEIALLEDRRPVAVKRALSRARKKIRDRWEI